MAQACVLHGFYMGCGFSALIIDLNQFTCNVNKLVWLKHVFYMCFTRVVASVHELLVVILNHASSHVLLFNVNKFVAQACVLRGLWL